jgi:lysophospholipase L1-like esterase
MVAAQARFVQPRRETRLGDIIRPSARPGVVYELIPGAETVFRGRELRVNAAGFRGPLHPEQKPPRTVRIVGLGDSVMFGWGVDERQSYLTLLAERLNARHPQVTWQVINTAVPGYNTAMEAAVLESRGLAYAPDLVIIGYVPNDLSLPNFLAAERNPWSLSESYLVERLTRGLQPARLVAQKVGPTSATLDGEVNEDQVSDQYRYMVGPDGYRRAMNRIDELRSEHGFELLVFSHIDRTPHRHRVRKILNELNVPFLSADEATQRYMREHGIQERLGSELAVSADDPHPSAIWHEVLCETILDHLESSGVARRLIERAAADQTSRMPM